VATAGTGAVEHAIDDSQPELYAQRNLSGHNNPGEESLSDAPEVLRTFRLCPSRLRQRGTWGSTCQRVSVSLRENHRLRIATRDWTKVRRAGRGQWV
jgi:hypothetical protein